MFCKGNPTTFPYKTINSCFLSTKLNSLVYSGAIHFNGIEFIKFTWNVIAMEKKTKIYKTSFIHSFIHPSSLIFEFLRKRGFTRQRFRSFIVLVKYKVIYNSHVLHFLLLFYGFPFFLPKS